MAESQREEERLESLRGDRLPWERGERLDQIRERREGGRALSKRRGEHEKRSGEQRGQRSGLDRDNKEKRGRSQRRGAGLSHLLTMPVCA